MYLNPRVLKDSISILSIPPKNLFVCGNELVGDDDDDGQRLDNVKEIAILAFVQNILLQEYESPR